VSAAFDPELWNLCADDFGVGKTGAPPAFFSSRLRKADGATDGSVQDRLTNRDPGKNSTRDLMGRTMGSPMESPVVFLVELMELLRKIKAQCRSSLGHCRVGACVDKPIEAQDKNLAKDKAQVLVSVNDDQYEEVSSYNEFINHFGLYDLTMTGRVRCANSVRHPNSGCRNVTLSASTFVRHMLVVVALWRQCNGPKANITVTRTYCINSTRTSRESQRDPASIVQLLI